MKPRKDEIWTLGAFQEVPGARKEDRKSVV